MKKIIAVLLLAILVSGCASTEYFLRDGQEINPVGRTYYTKVNMWHNSFGAVEQANIHRGSILPAGTEVKITRCSGRAIKFKASSGKNFTLINSRRYDNLTLAECFDRHFRDNQPTEDFAKFTDAERKNILNGNIEKGMSSEAVLAAWGYPPSKKTPLILANIWVYWAKGSIDKILVYFRENKVDTICPYSVDAELDFNMKTWVGYSANDLIASWGQPQQTLDDGQGGKMLIYTEERRYTTPGYSFSNTSGNFNSVWGRHHSGYSFGGSNTFGVYTPPQTTRWTVSRTFWVNKEGKVYRWAWKGR
ncbi:MAG TPA: hypothetical protein PKI44_06360 [Candidatus Omnitrophota bacterium]|nr:hypothetical protein [Candidatus Omnitrophota bacterium]